MSAFAAASTPGDADCEASQTDEGQGLAWGDGDEDAAALAAAAADDAALLAPQVGPAGQSWLALSAACRCGQGVCCRTAAGSRLLAGAGRPSATPACAAYDLQAGECK